MERTDGKLGGENVLEVPSNHHSDDVRFGYIAPLNGLYLPPVLEDGDVISDLEDFAHAMGDEKNCAALALELADQAKEPARVGGAKSGCRFVEEDDPGIKREGFQDLSDLLPFQGKVRCPLIDIQMNIEP